MENKLPGYNCKQCGYDTCSQLAQVGRIDLCKFVTVSSNRVISEEKSDFRLHPLPNEPSCREYLFVFSPKSLRVNDIIRYRPLGCPIIHFGKIIGIDNGVVCVHLIRPKNIKKTKDVGIGIVGGFEGVVEGAIPVVTQTVRFVPHKCMMQFVHLGIVVSVVGKRVRIEQIDLKSWRL